MIMDMAKGNAVEYKTIMNGTVEELLLKFEHYTDEIRRIKKETDKIRAGQRKWHK